MGYSAKVGSFNLDSTKTAGQTQAITGVGFQPKIVLFFWGGSTGTSDTVSGGNAHCGFGAAISSSSRFCHSVDMYDALETTETETIQTALGCIKMLESGAVEKRVDFYSMDAGGFTLIYDHQVLANYRISYLALGGDDLTNVYIGNKAEPNATGNFDTTDVGFQPDTVIFAGGYQTTIEGADYHAYFNMGMATSSSNQGVIGCASQNGVGTSNTTGYGYDGECKAFVATSSIGDRLAFVEFLSNGFRLNKLDNNSAKVFHYIALKGGQYSVGNLNTRTDGNDISETVGFQPVALLFSSANRALSTQDTLTDNARVSIGAGTSASERACAAISDEDNLGVSETAYANYDSAVYAQVVDDAMVGLMDIKSIDSSGFTCVMDDTDPSACWVTYIAIGAASGGTALNINICPENNYVAGVKIYNP